MKLISIYILIPALLCASQLLGQGGNPLELRTDYPDTLTLTTDNKNEVLFMFNRLGRDKQYFNTELWKSMLGVMETAIERSTVTNGVLVTYHNNGDGENEAVKITIKELENPENTFIIGKDEIKEKLASRIEFLIIQPKVAVSFSISNSSDLEEIKAIDVETIWTQIQTKFDDHGKNNLYRGTGDIKYGTVTIDGISAYRKRLDNLELTFVGVGLGFYRDRFVPDIGSKVAFKMHNRHGKEWIDFGVLYTNQFFYSRDEAGDFNLSPNGWLTVFTKFHAPSGDKFGLGVGGLIHRKGDFYNGSTYKVSVYGKEAGTRFTFSPEFVFTDNFKDFFPALRIGLSF